MGSPGLHPSQTTCRNVLLTAASGGSLEWGWGETFGWRTLSLRAFVSGQIYLDLQMVGTWSSVKETPSDSQPGLPPGPKDSSGSPAGALLGSPSHQGVGF